VLTTGSAHGTGADLYVERRGSGPPLLLIVGGGGDCGYYGRLADILADEFTVLSYDRRGNSRSRLHARPGPLVMAEQRADALAVLQASGFSSALVFGNSGGASIALDLAAHHPDRLDAVVAHEPPVPAVLPDPAPYLAIFDEVDRLLRTEGWVAAFTHFQVALGLVPPQIVATLLDPGPRLPPGPLREQLVRVSRNWEYLTRYEIRPFIDHQPDLERIAANRVPVALARGAATSDQAVIQMCETAAGRLGMECVVFPGGHTAAMEIPGEFGAALRPLLHRLTSTAPAS
jgi:pimeloyl-ACP methyl ester carboxylesterase